MTSGLPLLPDVIGGRTSPAVPALQDERRPANVRKSHRRRIVCPTLPTEERRAASLAQTAGRSSSSCSTLPPVSRTRSQSPPLHVESSFPATIKVIYYSRDGEPAATGGNFVLQVGGCMLVEEVRRLCSERLNVSSKGRLLFHNKSLKSGHTLFELGIEPPNVVLHFMLSRKHKRADVEDDQDDIRNGERPSDHPIDPIRQRRMERANSQSKGRSVSPVDDNGMCMFGGSLDAGDFMAELLAGTLGGSAAPSRMVRSQSPEDPEEAEDIIGDWCD